MVLVCFIIYELLYAGMCMRDGIAQWGILYDAGMYHLHERSVRCFVKRQLQLSKSAWIVGQRHGTISVRHHVRVF